MERTSNALPIVVFNGDVDYDEFNRVIPSNFKGTIIINGNLFYGKREESRVYDLFLKSSDIYATGEIIVGNIEAKDLFAAAIICANARVVGMVSCKQIVCEEAEIASDLCCNLATADFLDIGGDLSCTLEEVNFIRVLGNYN